eukprot:14941300-Alexandrium_andersonii.AAC.1
MGGSLSEPATLVDLGRRVHELYHAPGVAARAGLEFQGLTPRQLLAGCSHVDDALLWSGVFCARCIEACMAAFLPKDLALEAEETGASVTFLGTNVRC